MLTLNRFIVAATAFAALAGISSTASAALITYTDSMSGFTYDSDIQSSAFNAALGGSYNHLSFSGSSNVDGSSYSPLVTFSTKAGTFGGSNTGNVNANSEIGPYGTWDGILNIDFNGNFVSSIGFGLVEFNSPSETIRVYDDLNNLIGTFNDQLGDQFSLWGVSASAGERIGRIELDGNFFAIQDIEFSSVNHSSVPEPSSLALLAAGMFGLGFTRRFNRK